VHFPGDILDTPHIRAYHLPIIDFLTNFINTEIVQTSAELVAKYDMKFPPLQPYD